MKSITKVKNGNKIILMFSATNIKIQEIIPLLENLSIYQIKPDQMKVDEIADKISNSFLLRADKSFPTK
jgi:hypothetical protein